MAAPTPIHRDPDADGDDFGCVGRGAKTGNVAIVTLLTEARRLLDARTFAETDALVEFLQLRLEELEAECDCGCCDTVVKENIFATLHDAVENAGLEPIDQAAIYGW